jgi:hypothetical protein
MLLARSIRLITGQRLVISALDISVNRGHSIESAYLTSSFMTRTKEYAIVVANGVILYVGCMIREPFHPSRASRPPASPQPTLVKSQYLARTAA